MDNKYVSHYLDWKNAGWFLVVAFIGLIIVLLLIFLDARYAQRKSSREADRDNTLPADDRRKKKGKIINIETCQVVESFYELVFSSTSILFFLSAYYLIDRFMKIREYRVIWNRYDDILLMAFIFMSVFLNTLLDHCFVPLRTVKSSQKASIRLVSTIYMILIFLYIRFVYQDTNYNELIIYFVGLVIGRFIYFDFTWKDFSKTMVSLWENMPLLILIIIYSGLMCWVGFTTKFLLKSNGVIVSILIAHLFMDVSIFIVHMVLRHNREDVLMKKAEKKAAQKKKQIR